MSCPICDAYSRLGVKQAVADELHLTRSRVWRHLGRPCVHPQGSGVEPTSDYPFARVLRPHSRLVAHDGPLPRAALFIGDLHLPLVHERAFDAVRGYADDLKADMVFINGDLMDFSSISEYEKPELVRLQDEIERSKPYVRAIDAMPGRKLALMGNHDQRCERAGIKNKALSGLEVFEFGVLAKLPPSWTIYADQTHYLMGDLLLLHGNLDGGPKGGIHIADLMRAHLKHSCVFGHFHRDGVARPMVDYHGEPINEGHSIGWLGDANTAGRYIRKSDATVGFATIYFDDGRFEVVHHVWKRGCFLINGRRYA